eukprot:GHVL01003530.1.p2 GENE.GHVL01003530.1~~GHVL01003530.1.p2  ORF type:complete len:192 (-),score=47.16 GHVL01003530.1:893-1435(-)
MPNIKNEKISDQSIELSCARRTSSIPKSGTDTNWVFPSPQQFYNAMLRKNKQVDADYMAATVNVHNCVNEETWQNVLEWEAMHNDDCKSPKLAKFMGRSEDLSPRAMFNSYFSSMGKPFDRHDWFVDRCGIKNVRYIIDFYDDKRKDDEMQVTLDVRPALDDWESVWDRLRKPFKKNVNN